MEQSRRIVQDQLGESRFYGTSALRGRRLTRLVEARLQRLGAISRHPAFRVKMSKEGYSNFIFGAAAGPAAKLSNVLHDMAHAAEFGPDAYTRRSTGGAFRFVIPMQYLGEHSWPEMHTSQATQREIRTFAIQLHLMILTGCKSASTPAGLEREARVLVSSMVFMPDWWNVKGVGSRHHNNDARRKQRCTSQVLRHYAKLNRENIQQRILGWLDEAGREQAQAIKLD